jgi:hypothetical protein
LTAFRTPGNPPNTDTLSEIVRWLIGIAEILRQMMTGKLNATGSVTLTANSATTTLTDSRLGIGSVVLFDPTTATAATELYGATMYVLTANRSNGSWVITHANNATVTRTFKYLIIG